MSAIYYALQDSMHIFKDVRRGRPLRCLGVSHCLYLSFVAPTLSRTWILTTEEVTEPPKWLAEECKKICIDGCDVLVSDIGETKYF